MKVKFVLQMVNLYGRSDFLLRFDVEQIRDLMMSFYTLAGIRFVLFDNEFKEVISYPKENCDFCKLIKSCAKSRRKCIYADRRSFEKCRSENKPIIYKCHAGLVESVIPLHENEKIIGYLMFGQITDTPNKTDLYNKISIWNEIYGIDEPALKSSINAIVYKSVSEIKAAAKIMEACTSFIIYKELIVPDNSKILESVKAYIETRLSENIEVEHICNEFGIGRTKLYEIFRNELKTGISKYIFQRRMIKAKKLLKTTSLSIPDISSAVGFDDYNYFSRVYKKQYGKSPKHYRK